MTLTASRPAAPAVAPSPLPAPTPPDREPSPTAAGHPFAELLRQNRVADRAPVEASRPPAGTGGMPREAGANEVDGSDQAPATNDQSPKSEAGRARARSGANARSSTRPTTPERLAGNSDPVAQREPHEDDSAPADAATATHPAAAARPEAGRPADAPARLRSGAPAQQLDAAPGRGASGAAAEAGADAAAGPARQRRLGSDPAAPADAGRSAARARDDAAQAPAASFAQTLAEAKAQDRPVATAAGDRPLLPTLATAVAAHEPQSPAAPASDPAAPAATLPVPIDSPEFASAFGVQVSVFVGEGVQHAELHLNPAETGPVSISITLEGTQARVEFGADLAATRQAIENGLPALASALRDAGFTLAGGGVAQHSRPGGGQARDDPAGRGDPQRREARAADAIDAAAQRATRRIAAGGVDLYA